MSVHQSVRIHVCLVDEALRLVFKKALTSYVLAHVCGVFLMTTRTLSSSLLTVLVVAPQDGHLREPWLLQERPDPLP